MIQAIQSLRQSLRAIGLNTPGVGALLDQYDSKWDEVFGEQITVKKALGYSPMWRACDLISTSVAKLPIKVQRKNDDGTMKDDKRHPAWKLLRLKPNPAMTPFVFRKLLSIHKLLYGNGYAVIDRDGTDAPVEMRPLDPWSIYPVRVNGDFGYVWHDANGKAHGINPRNILHIKGLSLDGFVGLNVLDIHKMTLQGGISARDYGTKFFKNSSIPPIVIEHPKAITKEQIDLLREDWNRIHAGIKNSGRPAIVPTGVVVKPLGANARDSQLTDKMKFSVIEVSNITGVPPHKLGDSSRVAYNSLEEENDAFLGDTLDGHLCGDEEEYEAKLLTEKQREGDTHDIKHTREALLRSNLTDRGAYYSHAVQGGWMLLDEIRAKENMNPLPNGEGKKVRVPLALGESGGNSGDGDETDENAGKREVSSPKDDAKEASRAALQRLFEATCRRAAKRIATHIESKKGSLASVDSQIGPVEDMISEVCDAISAFENREIVKNVVSVAIIRDATAASNVREWAESYKGPELLDHYYR